MIVIFKFSYYGSGLLCCKNSLFEIGAYCNTQMLLGIVTTERKVTSYSEMYLPLSHAHTQVHSHFPVSHLLVLNLMMLQSNEKFSTSLVSQGRLCFFGCALQQTRPSHGPPLTWLSSALGPPWFVPTKALNPV